MDVTPCFKDEKLKNKFIKILKKCVIDIIKNIIKIIVNGVINIFIYHIEEKPEVLVEFFLIIKKINGKKDFNFVKDVGLEFIKIFNEIIEEKNKIRWSKKDKENSIYKRKIC